MSEIRSVRRLFSTLLILLVGAVVSASAKGPSLLSAEWNGSTLVLQFDSTLEYSVDLADSDSSLTIRFSDVVETGGITRTEDSTGVVGTFFDDGRAFRLRAGDRLGYSVLWRPHTHRLLIHTFDWEALDYASEQYHLGLLALEQGIPETAVEYLTAAYASDTAGISRRAASVLGVLHQELGNDSLAKIFLQDPSDPDDWGARAALLRSTGDTAAAAQAEEQMAASMERPEGIAAEGDPGREPVRDGRVEDGSFLTKWQGIGLAIVAGLLILAIATMFARTTPEAERAIEESIEHHREEVEEARRTREETAGVSLAEEEPATATEKPAGSVDLIPEHVESPTIDAESAEETDDVVVEADSSDAETPDLITETPTEQDRTLSRQAAALRDKVEAVRSGDVEEPEEAAATTEIGSEDDTVLDDARRRNVSRDFVELQRRIERLRPKG